MHRTTKGNGKMACEQMLTEPTPSRPKDDQSSANPENVNALPMPTRTDDKVEAGAMFLRESANHSAKLVLDAVAAI
jgi:hypothetical protein